MQDSERHSQPGRRRKADDYIDETSDTALDRAALLPQKGVAYALLIGALAAVISFVLNVVITFISASTFQQAARAGDNIDYNTALAVVGLQCLNFFVSLLICFFAGYIIGKTAVRRRLGFYAGMLTGALLYLGSFLVRYIPNYPGNMPSSGATNAGMVAGGILISLLFLVIWALIGGLVGAWGARNATRHHPYYYTQEEEPA